MNSPKYKPPPLFVQAKGVLILDILVCFFIAMSVLKTIKNRVGVYRQTEDKGFNCCCCINYKVMLIVWFNIWINL